MAKESSMKAQDLKKSILQLAIQGKLVEQDPNDEPATVLLERIKAEKEALVKAGKLKKDKITSFIYKADDGTFYENINGVDKDISDELPFDIPDSWTWVRLKEISDTYTGNSISEAEKNKKYTGLQEGLNYIGTKDVSFSNEIDYENGIKIPFSETTFKHAFPNAILMCIEGGSAGRKIALLKEEVCFGNKLCAFHPFIIPSEYIYIFLQTPYFLTVFQENLSGIIGGVSINKIKELLVPLPPLTEQKRIVVKIEELEPLIEEYDTAETALTALNTAFPEQMKKSILQQAIQGKLVEQDPNDEPATVLLERIKAEKAALVKAGKIKKDKPLPPITEDEIPFDIPDSWTWVRLKEICQINPKNSFDDNKETSFIPMALIKEGFVSECSFETKIWRNIKKGFTHFADNDIGIAKITPCFQNRKSAVFRGLLNGIGAGTTELHVLRGNVAFIDPYYILWFLKNESFINDGIKHFTGTAGQQRISKDFIENTLFPLPPLAEQKRIVAKIEELMLLNFI